jgi:ankyrin repeat protein
MNLRTDEPLAAAVVAAIHQGKVDALQRLLSENPGLAQARISNPQDCSGATRTLLHVATDWPGHFPNGAATVRALVAAGADVNARFTGKHTETPLHWAASSDDVEVLDALLDAGADLEASGAVIGGGTPLADAAAFAQWNAARRLVERGARTALWQAAALGLMDRVEKHFNGSPLAPWSPRGTPHGAPAPDEITHAFWCACHGGQQAAAQYLLARGARLDWIGYDGLTALEAARRSKAEVLVEWLQCQGAPPAK